MGFPFHFCCAINYITIKLLNSMKKKIVYLLLLSVLFYDCNKHDILGPGGRTPDFPGVPKEGVRVNTNVFGQVVGEDDKPLSGVMVTATGISAITDVNGIFMFRNINLDQARAYITATKPGYFKGSRIFQPKKDGMTRLPVIKMLAQRSIGTINAATGGAAASPGGIKVELPANAIEGYSGNINVVANYINPTSPDFFARMPGDLAADNTEGKRGSMISYGMSAIDLLDGSGNKLNIKAGAQATITLPVPKTLQASASSSIAMWYFDEVKGIWKEEGSGTYAGGKYSGKVSHFSMWNFDHWNPMMMLPMIFRWMLPKITSTDPDQDINKLLDNPPVFVLNVKDKKTKTTLYTNTIPSPSADANSNPRSASTEVSFPLPNVSDVMEVTVTPVQPGGPDYPTNPNYSPTGDEVPPQTPSIATDGESVTVEVTPTNPPTTVTITLPPQGGGGGNGETVVNVNGKAVNCDNKPVTTGYAFLSMRSGNTIVKSTTAPIFGNEGRFTVQYVFYTALPNRIDNVVLTIYDVATGKKSKDMNINVNPSVAYMIQDPVKICDENNGGGDPGNSKVYSGDYTINSAATLKAFIDSAYTEVTGTLYVSNIGDLGGITKLKKVGGLELRRNTITSLGGLAELESISNLSLIENGSLINAAFPKLANKEIQVITVSYNLSLVGLTLPSIEAISPSGNGYISITGSPVLKTLSIPNLKSVNNCRNIEITNTLLENLNTFSNASGTLGSWGLTLIDNASLTSVSALKNIVCTGRLNIDQCVKLTKLDGINIPADVTGFVIINRNDVLTDITAVSNKLKSTGILNIQSNKALQTATFPLLETAGTIDCKGNDAMTTISLSKLKTADAVSITNHAKLATFNMNVLETVSGTFEIHGGYETTQALTNFDLPALKSCGRLVIDNCAGITQLDGFANLEKVNGDLYINNPQIPGASIKLQTINGFNKLTTITNSLSLEQAAGYGSGLSGYDGPLASIKGFKNLKTVGASFNIGGKNLTDISGFANLETVGQETRIITTGLTGLEGLAKLKSIGSDVNGRLLTIQTNTKLTSLKGMAALTNASGIDISRNPELKDLQGLEKIKSMKAGIGIVANDKLAHIDGLANVEGAISSITITDNKILTSLCGITKVVKGGGNTGVYRVSGNAYNPTESDIKINKCQQ